MIPAETVDKIIKASQINDVIGDFVDLTPSGVSFKGVCPFHQGKIKSLNVSPEKNIYKCFSCGKGGNTINFLMEFNKWDYPQALNYLAKKYNIKPSNLDETLTENLINHSDINKTIKILEALVLGCSPLTGEMIDNDNILNEKEVVRALEIVINYLKTNETPTNSDIEIDFFQNKIFNKLSDKAIKQLKSKIDELGIIKTDNLSINIQNARAKYPRAYEPWTDTEKELLRKAIKYTNNLDLLSNCFQRGRGSIESCGQRLIYESINR